MSRHNLQLTALNSFKIICATCKGSEGVAFSPVNLEAVASSSDETMQHNSGIKTVQNCSENNISSFCQNIHFMRFTI